MPWYLAKYYFEVCPWGCFWMRRTHASVDWIKWIALPMSIGIIQSLEGLHRMKRGRKGDLSLSLCLTIWARTLVISCLWTQTYTINVLGSKARMYVHSCTHIHAFSTPETISVLSIAFPFLYWPQTMGKQTFWKKIYLQISLSFIQNFSKTLEVWQSLPTTNMRIIKNSLWDRLCVQIEGNMQLLTGWFGLNTIYFPSDSSFMACVETVWSIQKFKSSSDLLFLTRAKQPAIPCSQRAVHCIVFIILKLAVRCCKEIHFARKFSSPLTI